MMWVTIGPVPFIAAGILSGLILLVFAQIMPARTIAGARAHEATLGFKEFLGRVEEERMKKMITSPEMFERFLPYAMAFGVADKWAKAFEDIYREPPTWYVGGSGQFSASSFSHSISTMSSAAASSMASSPGSSGIGRWWIERRRKWWRRRERVLALIMMLEPLLASGKHNRRRVRANSPVTTSRFHRREKLDLLQ